MDLSFTAQELAFQAEVRNFLQTNLPKHLSDKVASGKHLTKEDMELWHSILNKKGWLASHWPKEYGGTGWGPIFKFIFDNELALAFAPRIVPFGVNMLAPVLIKYGSEEQKRYWLPRILNGEDWWCQGYSEPDSGSDLASVKTSAVREGDYYIVNGQKTWTTLGHYANMIFCLVRTDPTAKKQAGISFLLIDMSSPGVEVRPIITLDGAHEVNEVFFSNVKVPAANLVGVENQGWTCAKYLLTYERTNIAGVGMSYAALSRLKEIARKLHKNNLPLIKDPYFASSLAKVEIDLENMRVTNMRVLSKVAGGGAPGAESSMLKIRGTQIRQQITALARQAMGVYARPYIEEAFTDKELSESVGPEEAFSAATQYFNNRKLSIFGGSNEIQCNIISKMILGL